MSATPFSELFKRVVDESEIPISHLSHCSGLSSASIIKMKSGERCPKERDKVLKLFEALRCSVFQYEELIREYDIEQMGRTRYYSYRSMKRFIECFSNRPKLKLYPDGGMTLRGVHAVTGKSDVNSVVQAQIQQAVSGAGDCGKIQIAVTPEYMFLTDLLIRIGQKNEVLCEHIICMEPGNEAGALIHNLKIFEGIFPCIFSHLQYQPYYYYENIRAHHNHMSIFPYLIVTKNVAIQVSADFSKALVHCEKEQILVFQGIFDSMKQDCWKLVERMDSFAEYNGFVWEKYCEYGEGMCIECHPCLILGTTEELIQKYIDTGNPEAIALLRAFSSTFQLKRKMAYFSSVRALRLFVETGRIAEIPLALYHPITKKDCIQILKNYYDRMQNGDFDQYLVRDNQFDLFGNLELIAYPHHEVLVSFLENQMVLKGHQILEKGFNNLLCDFIEYLPNSDLCYSLEESKELFYREIQELEKQVESEQE